MSTTPTDWLQVCRDPAVEMVARILAKHSDGVDPGDTLEPGNTPFPDHTEVTDGRLRGASAFFRWRQFVARAKEIVDAVRDTTPRWNPMRTLHIATAYWCDDHWVIAAGPDEDRVKQAAEAYMNAPRPDDRHLRVEGYCIESVEETP